MQHYQRSHIIMMYLHYQVINVFVHNEILIVYTVQITAKKKKMIQKSRNKSFNVHFCDIKGEKKSD